MFLWNKRGHRLGSGSLLIELPTVTSDRMIELFGHGAGMKGQRNEKYSHDVLIQHKPSNQLFALYMANGYWRIGGAGTVISRIGELLEYLDPVKYQGLGIVRDDIALVLASNRNDGIE